MAFFLLIDHPIEIENEISGGGKLPIFPLDFYQVFQAAFGNMEVNPRPVLGDFFALLVNAAGIFQAVNIGVKRFVSEGAVANLINLLHDLIGVHCLLLQ